MRFENLINPISTNTFKLLFEERPELKVWHTAADPNTLFGWNDLNHTLRQQRINDTDIAILRNGEKVMTREVSDKVRRKFATANQLNREKLLEVLRSGGSMRISRVDEKSELLESLAIDIERILDCQTNMNLYASFGSMPALLAHADTHDILVVQLEGEKEWEVFGFGNDPFPIRHHKEADCPRKTVWSGLLRKGELLFMPRGSWHKAKACEGTPSLHITIGFNHVMLYTLSTWLEQELSQHVIYRKHLLSWETKDDAGVETTIKQVMNDILAEGFLSRFRTHTRRSRPKRFDINLPDITI